MLPQNLCYAHEHQSYEKKSVMNQENNHSYA
jgi:hypothetical protein